MRQILTAFSFIAILLAPPILAMRATKNESPSKRPRRSKEPITIFGKNEK